ncbi:unnamed protein product, partial [Ectocarpus sp. 12 AP-2014]
YDRILRDASNSYRQRAHHHNSRTIRCQIAGRFSSTVGCIKSSIYPPGGALAPTEDNRFHRVSRLEANRHILHLYCGRDHMRLTAVPHSCIKTSSGICWSGGVSPRF